jgi:hypothetical protein
MPFAAVTKPASRLRFARLRRARNDSGSELDRQVALTHAVFGRIIRGWRRQKAIE